MRTTTLHWVSITSQDDGIALEDGTRAIAQRRSRPAIQSERFQYLRGAHAFALNGGRPLEALRATDELREVQPYPRTHLWLRVMDALYSDGDSSAATQAVDELAAYADAPLSPDANERRLQYIDMCVVEQWRLQHRDVSSALGAIARLTEPGAPEESPETIAHNEICSAVLETLLAAAPGRARLAAELTRLDSLMLQVPAITERFLGRGYRWSFVSILIARLREQQGDLVAALSAARRWQYFLDFQPYLSSHLLLEARLASQLGDRERATRAYRHYLTLRSDPEPALQTQVDHVRAELAKLLGEARAR